MASLIVAYYDVEPVGYTPPFTPPTGDLLHIPLYEQYAVTGSYFFNQPVINSLRWTGIGASVGAAAGGIYDYQQTYVFIPASFIFGLAGAGAGFLAGISIGIVKGIKFSKLKQSDPDFHTWRSSVGYEYTPLLFGIPSKDNYHRNSREPYNFSLAYRPLSEKRSIPSKISIGYFNERWEKWFDSYPVSNPGDMFGNGELYLHRIEAIVRYDFFKRKFLIPYWAVGAGYAWGQEHEMFRVLYYDSYWNRFDTHPAEGVPDPYYSISSPVLRGYLGGELNIFDFCYIDLMFCYETIGPYLFLHNRHYFPYAQNFMVNFSCGTFIY